MKHPEHNTTDVIIEFPNGTKFVTTFINREYEDEMRALIGRTIYNIVYNQLKIEKAMLAHYIYEKGILITHKVPPKSLLKRKNLRRKNASDYENYIIKEKHLIMLVPVNHNMDFLYHLIEM